MAMELTGYFTTAGWALYQKTQTGTALSITRVDAGSGDTEQSAAVLETVCQTLSVNPWQRQGNTVTLPTTAAAALAEADYVLREVGVYAQDPDQGEILYWLYKLKPGMDIVAGDQLVLDMALQLTVSESADVQVIGTANGLLYERHKGVAGGVAALDETGKVPAVQLPAMEYAPPYTYGTEELTPGVSELKSGRLHFVYA